jgi:PPP family 3-phenylpropionic acid transporter
MPEKRIRSLTPAYAGLQACYWAVNCVLFAFASVFLQANGLRPTVIGVILALATALSGLLQPVVAAFADRTKRVSLRTIVAAGGLLCLVFLAALCAAPAGSLLFAACFLFAALLNDLSQPMMNALSVYCCDRGRRVDFSVARSIGSFAFAAVSVVLGKLSAAYGAGSMLVVCLAACAVFTLLALSFPSLRGAAPVRREQAVAQEACTLPQFFRKYRAFCLSLTGVFCFTCFHLMTEHYLFQMLRHVGGGERDLGVNLFLSTLVEIPAILLFSRFGRRARTETWLHVAGVSFLLKAICFALAPSVWMIHAAQIFQATSFGIYVPASVLYAQERVAPEDMVKGQAMVAAAYTLGGSLGNLIGGRIIDLRGVPAMLWTGVAFAAAGAVILFLTVRPRKN